jgi:hypothetical protein
MVLKAVLTTLAPKRTLVARKLSTGDILTGKLAQQEVAAVEHVEGAVVCQLFDRQTLAESVIHFRADRRVVVEA